MSTCSIDDLPSELLQGVFTYLSQSEMDNAAKVCRRWRDNAVEARYQKEQEALAACVDMWIGSFSGHPETRKALRSVRIIASDGSKTAKALQKIVWRVFSQLVDCLAVLPSDVLKSMPQPSKFFFGSAPYFAEVYRAISDASKPPSTTIPDPTDVYMFTRQGSRSEDRALFFEESQKKLRELGKVYAPLVLDCFKSQHMEEWDFERALVQARKANSVSLMESVASLVVLRLNLAARRLLQDEYNVFEYKMYKKLNILDEGSEHWGFLRLSGPVSACIKMRGAWNLDAALFYPRLAVEVAKCDEHSAGLLAVDDADASASVAERLLKEGFVCAALQTVLRPTRDFCRFNQPRLSEKDMQTPPFVRAICDRAIKDGKIGDLHQYLMDHEEEVGRHYLVNTWIRKCLIEKGLVEEAIPFYNLRPPSSCFEWRSRSLAPELVTAMKDQREWSAENLVSVLDTIDSERNEDFQSNVATYLLRLLAEQKEVDKAIAILEAGLASPESVKALLVPLTFLLRGDEALVLWERFQPEGDFPLAFLVCTLLAECDNPGAVAQSLEKLPGEVRARAYTIIAEQVYGGVIAQLEKATEDVLFGTWNERVELNAKLERQLKSAEFTRVQEIVKAIKSPESKKAAQNAVDCVNKRARNLARLTAPTFWNYSLLFLFRVLRIVRGWAPF